MKNLILKLQINSNDSTREIRLTCSFLLVYNVLKLTSEQLVLSVAEASERQVKTFHFSLFTPNSSLPTPNSSLPTPNSSLPTPHSQLPTPNSTLFSPLIPSPKFSQTPFCSSKNKYHKEQIK